MPTRRAALLIAVGTLGMPCVVGVMPTVAAEASATAFVTKIYDAYKGENSKGIPIDTDAAIRRYFEPSLAVLISLLLWPIFAKRSLISRSNRPEAGARCRPAFSGSSTSRSTTRRGSPNPQ
jgi:hypothetical protein